MNGTHPIDLSPEHIAVLKRTMLAGFSDDEQESFLALCQRNHLDPFSKQIYATRRWVKDRSGNKVPTLVPVTSLLGLTANAIRTGHYDGCVVSWAGKDGVWRDEWLSDEFPAAARAIVYHKQRAHPEIGIARWAGYCGQSYNKTTNRWEVTDFWERLPDFMLAKCAKAQALRGAFPDQCSNLYITEELQGNISEADQYDDEAKVASNRTREEELLKKAATQGVRVVESKPAKRPTPAEAAAPAFEEPVPPKPMSTAPVVPVVPPSPQEEPDDLDMGELAAAQPGATADAPAGPTAAPDQTWKYHVIEGLTNPKFHGRVVGDLNVSELQAIEEQWLPKVHAVLARGETLKASQKADADAFELAIAHYKAEKPW